MVVAYKTGLPGTSRCPMALIQPRDFKRFKYRTRDRDTADFLNIAARYRLTIGNNSKRFKHRA